MGILIKLMEVQNGLKAPKDQFNGFGNYKYRSCEDILESVKPLLKTQGLVLKISDEAELIGDRFYIKATATVYDVETGERESVSAYAREEETKKGMDASQITGSVSSYARKYALNGLFCIDDTKDADATNKHDKGDSKDSEDKSSQNDSKPSGATETGFKCSSCGKQVTEKVSTYSIGKFHKVLCMDCQKGAK